MVRARNRVSGRRGWLIAVSPRGARMCLFYDGQEHGTGGVWENGDDVEVDE